MATNNGARLTVFGLTFRQHDNRQMQQILRAYGRLPSNPGQRPALFTGLFELSRDLEDEEIQDLTIWLQDGGDSDDFPTPKPASPPPSSPAAVSNITSIDGDQEENLPDDDEEEWEHYEPTAFEDEGGHVGHNDAGDPKDEEMTSDEAEPAHPHVVNPEDDASTADTDQAHENDVEDALMTEAQDGLRDFDESDGDLQFMCNLGFAENLLPREITSACNHESGDRRRACFGCVKFQLASNIRGGDLTIIRCPFCPELSTAKDVENYANLEDFARYERLCQFADPNVVMCLASDCESGQIHPNTLPPKMICDFCSFATCAHHKLPWHDGLTCEEFDCSDDQIERLEQAEATAKLLSKDKSKVCPTCKNGVSREEGCDHLRCRCGGEWCFECLASWENIMRIGISAHGPNCPNHPNSVRKTKKQLEAGQAQLTETLMGGAASEALLRARGVRNERIQADIRPKALEAAEARMKAMREADKDKENEGQAPPKKKRVKLLPAWEE